MDVEQEDPGGLLSSLRIFYTNYSQISCETSVARVCNPGMCDCVDLKGNKEGNNSILEENMDKLPKSLKMKSKAFLFAVFQGYNSKHYGKDTEDNV